MVSAAPVNYVINFTLDYDGPLPTSGAFTYDSAVPEFSAFTFEWAGYTLDLTAEANAPILSGDPACLGGSTGAAATFMILNGVCPGMEWFAGEYGGYVQLGFQDDFASISIDDFFFDNTIPDDRRAGGSWEIEAVPSVPEPSSITLTLSALLAAAVAFRRRSVT